MNSVLRLRRWLLKLCQRNAHEHGPGAVVVSFWVVYLLLMVATFNGQGSEPATDDARELCG
jgi:hypothetical protein